MGDSIVVVATLKACAVRNAEGGFLQTGPFLDVCRLVLPVVDKLGTAFALVKSDINGNIQRLADRSAEDPDRYKRLFTIVQDEVVSGTHGGSTSCTKGLLWLKRAMEFMLAILRNLLQRPDDSLAMVVGDTYSSTLMRFHGFIVSSAFTLAFKFVPSREVFLESLGGGQAVNQQLAEFVNTWAPILQEVHQFMVDNNLDDPTKV